jgi:low temperature requirement protein LtrA
VAATAVSGQERSSDLMVAGGLAVFITCMLWWSYFSWVSEYLEEQLSKKLGSIQARFARDVYSFLHFLIICGIIGVAFALSIEYALFIGISAVLVWRADKIVLLPRLIILIASIAGVVLSVGQLPVLALTIISLSLLLINIIEWKKCQHS